MKKLFLLVLLVVLGSVFLLPSFIEVEARQGDARNPIASTVTGQNMREVQRLARQYNVTVARMILVLTIVQEIGGMTIEEALLLSNTVLSQMIWEHHQAIINERKGPPATYYDLVFKDDDGTVLKEERLKAGDKIVPPEMPDREHYLFLGWADDPETNELYEIGLMPDHDLYLYAVWQEVLYELVFMDEDGTALKEESLRAGSEIVPPEMADREQYLFLGWTDDLATKELYEIGSMPNHNLYLYAVWQDVVRTKAAVSLGSGHSALITEECRVFTWGYNNAGQLGDGTSAQRNIPTEISDRFALFAGESVIQIATGWSHSAAVTSSGRVFTWGANWYGQLGDGTTAQRNTPTDITNGFNLGPDETIIQVSLGYFHSAATTSAGRIFTWGFNHFGQLGDGTAAQRNIPTDITNGFGLGPNEKVVQIALGYHHSAAVTSAGRIFTWGQNGHGQLGDGTTTQRHIPTQITNRFGLAIGETVTQINMGYLHSAAVTSTGRVFTWGVNFYGQLGDGTTAARNTPTPITNRFNLSFGETVIQIALGYYHSAAVTSTGRVFTWGYNNMGQLGDGTTLQRNTPVQITNRFDLGSGETVTQIALGNYHSAAVTSAGRVFTWGLNNVGQLGDNTTTNKNTPTSIN